MDDQQTQGNENSQGGKQSFKARFKGADGSEGYNSGEEYTLQRWEENGMTLISKDDGTGQVTYNSEEELMNNWEEIPQEEAQAGSSSDQGGTQTP